MKIRLDNQEKMMADRRNIGAQIAKYRIKKKMTEEQLSELCKVDCADIYKIESGDTEVDFDVLAKVISAMGFDLEFKVSAKVKPMKARGRESIELTEGQIYYVSFGSHKATPCTFLKHLDRVNGKRILVEVERGRYAFQHVLFPDEIGRTPEEAVLREVTW